MFRDIIFYGCTKKFYKKNLNAGKQMLIRFDQSSVKLFTNP